MPSVKSSRSNGPETEMAAATGAYRSSGGYETSAPQTHHDTASEGRPATNKPKRRKNRHRKRRNRRQSFLAPEESHTATAVSGAEAEAMIAGDQPHSPPPLPFYNLGRDLSSTSLESEALLDHRNQPMMRPRRESRLAQSFRPGSMTIPPRSTDLASRGTPSGPRGFHAGDDSDGSEGIDDHTPLIRPPSGHHNSKSWYGTDAKASPFASRQRRASMQSTSSRCSPRGLATSDPDRDYDINNPPSVPSSPKLGGEMNYDDAVVTGADFDFALAKSIDNRNQAGPRPNDMVIDVDGRSTQPKPSTQSSPSSPHLPPHEALRRRRTVALPVEEDVCFPIEEASELAEEDARRTSREDARRRRRTKEWPDLSVLEEWSREEKEERTGVLRAKKISEPVLIEGRLRPQFRVWRREEDEAPYRFTYFNEEFQSTIHAQSISELVQPGGSFRELFIPDPPELEDSSDEEDFEDENIHSDHFTDSNHNGQDNAKAEEAKAAQSGGHNVNGATGPKLQHVMSVISEGMSEARTSVDASPARKSSPPKPKKFGPRPTFWLDVLSPTDAEMRVIAKAFGIHALTAEDIMMQEAREKVELFRSYYFVNYRTFEQDPNSENYLQPVNMYIVVFREGILSFHFSQTPHPANVRRRIRQLMDYLILSSDWISYALIDDITDVFGPLIQSIEDEVDEIDEKIMKMHSPGRPMDSNNNNPPNRREDEDEEPEPPAPGEMLRRVGECRKKVMGMYRLLSNKADVVKGFAKRCNEHWEVAPKSEIGLYLGDIQDHIMTMTSSLTYYETLLSRAHSNYLAQINILMNERQEQTADVLGKLTVLGTIVLPMNIICGMWGMNVKVPGQDIDNLWWFWSITGGLIFFAFASFLIAKRVYKIV
ncbi:putative metal ion transporter C17A12.14 [Aspergillus udagawae]|uniref:CorA metal ion transporter n=1 Tax=Aspergillus udagawae TaxID=91492 RepID=A0A8E0QLA7_9EURO|nr:corA metal ion transporter [Aspergillus udagawae]GFF51263.1 putative metal ion transporter C17A12.14 [Aspergillus udagawae]GFF52020.1 putative metal ion transporter C17A12.14 [Aspergillus udagawae]GFF85127.1 putative metal ion transporter C17A12.14 [Aspergillus udagawae]GFG19079.1 putative metal ion transporter C17A12.14 [Aspergillus udagawae]GIC84976.1 corA metal ion transporter [Aspergillus udagawae]